MKTSLSLIAITALLSLARPAIGSPIYYVITDSDPVGQLTLLSGSTAQQLAVPAPFTGQAIAGPAGLGAVVNGAFAQGPNQNSEGTAAAALVLDDLVFSGPGSTVHALLNLHLSGSLSWSGPGGLADPTVFVAAALTNDVEDAFQSPVAVFDPCTFNTAPACTTQSLVINLVVTADLGNVQVGVPLVLTIGVGSVLGFDTNGNTGGPFTGSADFLNTLTFVHQGSVFTLPAGFTANSVGAGIVDNLLVPAEPTSVPEPSTLVLIAGGLVAEALRRRASGRSDSYRQQQA